MAALLSVASHGWAALFVPPWQGDQLSASASFLFPDDSTSPEGDTLANQYGTPSALISLSQGASGWQDPEENSFTIPGRGGAWDIGSSEGSLSLFVPMAPEGDATPKTFSFAVEVIYLSAAGIASGPLLELPNGWNGTVTSEVFPSFSNQGPFDIWDRVVWQGSMVGFSGDSFDFALLPAAGPEAAVIDSVSVYTVIPEPGRAVLLALSALLLLVRRRV